MYILSKLCSGSVNCLIMASTRPTIQYSSCPSLPPSLRISHRPRRFRCHGDRRTEQPTLVHLCRIGFDFDPVWYAVSAPRVSLVKWGCCDSRGGVGKLWAVWYRKATQYLNRSAQVAADKWTYRWCLRKRWIVARLQVIILTLGPRKLSNAAHNENDRCKFTYRWIGDFVHRSLYEKFHGWKCQGFLRVPVSRRLQESQQTEHLYLASAKSSAQSPTPHLSQSLFFFFPLHTTHSFTTSSIAAQATIYHVLNCYGI